MKKLLSLCAFTAAFFTQAFAAEPIALTVDKGGSAVRVTLGPTRNGACGMDAATQPLVAVELTEAVEGWSIVLKPAMAGVMVTTADGKRLPGTRSACLSANKDETVGLAFAPGRYLIAPMLDYDDRRKLSSSDKVTILLRPAKGTSPLLKVATAP